MSTSKTFENGYILILRDGRFYLSHVDFEENEELLHVDYDEAAAAALVEELPHPQAEEIKTAWKSYTGADVPVVKTPAMLAKRMRAGMSPPAGTPPWIRRAAQRQLGRRG